MNLHSQSNAEVEEINRSKEELTSYIEFYGLTDEEVASALGVEPMDVAVMWKNDWNIQDVCRVGWALGLHPTVCFGTVNHEQERAEKPVSETVI